MAPTSHETQDKLSDKESIWGWQEEQKAFPLAYIFFFLVLFFDLCIHCKADDLILEERGAERKSNQKVITREECNSGFLVTIKDADLTCQTLTKPES